MRRKIMLLVFLAMGIFISCNNKEVKKQKRALAASVAHTKSYTADFVNDQYADISYQIEAFKIGKERILKPELKKYLEDNLEKLEQNREQLKEIALKENIPLNEPKTYEKELYKLTIADAKGFDDVFVLYYKEFLKTAIQKLTENDLEKNVVIDSFKNDYGKTLYEQKLYFDLLK